jgi:NAD(P)-dependent dehydrogenase (short-subunit alcohol dehydrogenase family)
MSGRLSGKIAIVTGGAGGIGTATCRLFVREGASVALVDQDKDAASAAAAEIRKEFPEADILEIQADIADSKEVRKSVDAVTKRWNKLHILVNNAGIREYYPLATAPDESWRKILDVNLLGATYFIQASLPIMRVAGGSSIINISSTYGVHGRAGMGQYDVTKAGLLSVTKTLAFEEAAHNVRVNAVCPGYILTPFHKQRMEAAGKSSAGMEEEEIPYCLMKRWANPIEIAYPILWLASDEASYFTGTALMADGGRPVV